MEMLCLQGPLLRAAGTPALLTPDLFGSHPLGADEPRPEPLDPVEEKAAGEKAVQRLGTLLLAFDGEARRQMDEKDTRGGLVDLLPPGTRERMKVSRNSSSRTPRRSIRSRSAVSFS